MDISDINFDELKEASKSIVITSSKILRETETVIGHRFYLSNDKILEYYYDPKIVPFPKRDWNNVCVHDLLIPVTDWAEQAERDCGIIPTDVDQKIERFRINKKCTCAVVTRISQVEDFYDVNIQLSNGLSSKFNGMHKDLEPDYYTLVGSNFETVDTVVRDLHQKVPLALMAAVISKLEAAVLDLDE